MCTRAAVIITAVLTALVVFGALSAYYQYAPALATTVTETVYSTKTVYTTTTMYSVYNNYNSND